MPIEAELLRSCILDAFRRKPGTQYVNLDIDTARVAGERGLPIRAGTEPHLELQDMRRFRETVWALIVEGIVVIGMDAYNDQWPWLSLTEYGEEVVSSGGSTPYDPDGYLAALAAQAALDDVEQRYVPQALTAFRHNLADAAAIMIGAASEHLIILLGERVEATDAAASIDARKRLDGSVLPLLLWLEDYIGKRSAALDRDLRESLHTTFLGIAALIRSARNDAGHPTLGVVSRDQAFVSLRLFPPYRAWVVRVMARLPL
jgi:hypothetical protein